MVSKTSISLLLIALLILTVAATTTIQAVKASNAVMLFTPNCPNITGVDPAGEAALSDSVANTIFNYFLTYPPGNDYSYYLNAQDSVANYQNYVSCINYGESYFSNVVFYSKGHCVPWGDGEHYELIPYDYNNQTYSPAVKDTVDVYPNTGSAYDFVFLWHCATADPTPYYPPAHEYAGMPYCFTHDVNMDPDGYDDAGNGSPEVLVGFHNYSPEYMNSTDYMSYNYGSFVTDFFMYLTEFHCSAAYALNYAAHDTLGCGNYEWSALNMGYIMDEGGMGNLNSCMVIYGDALNGLPS